MIKAKAIGEFTLQRFSELENIKRRNLVEEGKIFIGDTFECSEELAEYLNGKNPIEKSFIDIIEIIPEEQPKKRRTRKKIE